MNSNLKRLEELRSELRKIYKEKSEIEQEIVKEIIESKADKEIELDEHNVLTLVWLFDKKIDYEKLQEKYPDVYELGVKTTFSVSQAMQAVDKKLITEIIRDCTTVDPHYKIKVRRKK